MPAEYVRIVATRDHHVDPGPHFSGQPDYADSWPPHCVAGTPGAAFHPDSGHQPVRSGLPQRRARCRLQRVRRLSSVRRHAEPPADPPRPARRTSRWPTRHGVTAVDIAGIATDYCVRATAADAARLGFAVRVLSQPDRRGRSRFHGGSRQGNARERRRAHRTGRKRRVQVSIQVAGASIPHASITRTQAPPAAEPRVTSIR